MSMVVLDVHLKCFIVVLYKMYLEFIDIGLYF